jgi:hypothetical protein
VFAVDFNYNLDCELITLLGPERFASILIQDVGKHMDLWHAMCIRLHLHGVKNK